MTIENLISERNETHGTWEVQATFCQNLKKEIRAAAGFHNLALQQQEAIESIVVKISRIIIGDSKHNDHWDDISGYAQLGKVKK